MIQFHESESFNFITIPCGKRSMATLSHSEDEKTQQGAQGDENRKRNKIFFIFKFRETPFDSAGLECSTLHQKWHIMNFAAVGKGNLFGWIRVSPADKKKERNNLYKRTSSLYLFPPVASTDLVLHGSAYATSYHFLFVYCVDLKLNARHNMRRAISALLYLCRGIRAQKQKLNRQK